MTKPALLRLLLLTLAFILVAANGYGQTDEAIEACFSAYEETQVLLKDQKFEMARETSRRCSQGCPEEITTQCKKWEWEAERKAPSVLLVARFENGDDAPGVSVTVNGQWRPLQKEVLLDPGPHKIRFFREDGWEYEINVEILADEKQRTIRATVPSETAETPPPPVAARSSHVPWAIASFSVGAVGLGLAGAFTLVAINQKSDLDECAAVGCREVDVQRAHDSLTVADVGLVVGAVGVATGLGILIWGKPRAKSATAALGVAPTPGGLATVLSGRF